MNSPTPFVRRVALLAIALASFSGIVPAFAETFLLDFGASDTPTPGWNNLGPSEAVHTAGDIRLTDTDGKPAGVAIRFERPFNGVNASGPTAAPELPFPATAVQDSLYGNGLPWSSGYVAKDEPLLPVIEFIGLDPTKLYTFTYFASRMGDPRRDTDYVLSNGGYTTLASLDAANNTARTVSSAPIQPSPDGRLILELIPGEANATPQKFVYLSLLKIEAASRR